MSAIQEIKAERERQRRQWGNKHDDNEHGNGAMSFIAAKLAWGSLKGDPPTGTVEDWRCLDEMDKRKRLVMAGALIVAEIERLDREQARFKREDAAK